MTQVRFAGRTEELHCSGFKFSGKEKTVEEFLLGSHAQCVQKMWINVASNILTLVFQKVRGGRSFFSAQVLLSEKKSGGVICTQDS